MTELSDWPASNASLPDESCPRHSYTLFSPDTGHTHTHTHTQHQGFSNPIVRTVTQHTPAAHVSAPQQYVGSFLETQHWQVAGGTLVGGIV